MDEAQSVTPRLEIICLECINLVWSQDDWFKDYTYRKRKPPEDSNGRFGCAPVERPRVIRTTWDLDVETTHDIFDDMGVAALDEDLNGLESVLETAPKPTPAAPSQPPELVAPGVSWTDHAVQCPRLLKWPLRPEPFFSVLSSLQWSVARSLRGSLRGKLIEILGSCFRLWLWLLALFWAIWANACMSMLCWLTLI